MKSILSWTVLPGAMREAVDRFLSTGAPAQEGVTMLGRWHRTRGAMLWADVLKFESHAVIEDAQAGPVLADVFKK